MMRNAQFVDEGTVYYAMVEEPEGDPTLSRENLEDPSLWLPPPFAQDMIRRWHANLLEAFPMAPKNWVLNITRSGVFTTVLIVIEDPNGGVPQLIGDPATGTTFELRAPPRRRKGFVVDLTPAD